MVKNEKIVITGSCGFIGKHLAERLGKDNEIIGIDIAGDPKVDVTWNYLENFIPEGAIMIHCASIAGVDNVIKDPIRCQDIIIDGTRNMINAAIKRKAKKFINFSTSEVMRNTAHGNIFYSLKDSMNVLEARWVYSNSKYAMEGYILRKCKDAGIPAVNIRPFNVFGPRQKTGGAVLTILKKALANEDILLTNRGETLRSWLYIEDMIDAVLLCIEKNEANYKSWCIGNPKSTLTIYELARMIIRLSDSQSKIVVLDESDDDIELRIPNIDEARHQLGFNPKFNLEEGIVETIYSMKGN